MKIANNVAFGTISYILKGETKLNIRNRRMGYWKEEIFVGTLSELWQRENESLRWKLEKMKVNAISADGDVLFMGVEE